MRDKEEENELIQRAIYLYIEITVGVQLGVREATSTPSLIIRKPRRVSRRRRWSTVSKGNKRGDSGICCVGSNAA